MSTRRQTAAAAARAAAARPPAARPVCAPFVCAGRGPKTNGRGSAPNVRAWGARQAAIGLVFFYAFFSAEPAAYTAALIALFMRVLGDSVQNLLDGCYWKLGVFVPVEGMAILLIYLSL